MSKSSMHASGSLGLGGAQVTNLATHKRSSQELVGGRKSKKGQCLYEEKAEGSFIMRGMRPKQKSHLSGKISQLHGIGQMPINDDAQMSVGGRSSGGASRQGLGSRQEVISNTPGYTP